MRWPREKETSFYLWHALNEDEAKLWAWLHLAANENGSGNMLSTRILEPPAAFGYISLCLTALWSSDVFIFLHWLGAGPYLHIRLLEHGPKCASFMQWHKHQHIKKKKSVILKYENQKSPEWERKKQRAPWGAGLPHRPYPGQSSPLGLPGHLPG